MPRPGPWWRCWPDSREKFGKLLVALRDEKDPLKAIEQVYGWDEKKLEAEWHKEVLAQR